MAYHDEDDNKKYREEIKRFYNQKKSTRRECNFGSKNCSTCDKKDCEIRLYVINYSD